MVSWRCCCCSCWCWAFQTAWSQIWICCLIESLAMHPGGALPSPWWFRSQPSSTCAPAFLVGGVVVCVASSRVAGFSSVCVSPLFVSGGVVCEASSLVVRSGLSSVCVSPLFVSGGVVCEASSLVVRSSSVCASFSLAFFSSSWVCAALSWVAGLSSVCAPPFLEFLLVGVSAAGRVGSVSSVGARRSVAPSAPANAANKPKSPLVSAGAFARAASQLSAVVGTVLCCGAKSPAMTGASSCLGTPRLRAVR